MNHVERLRSGKGLSIQECERIADHIEQLEAFVAVVERHLGEETTHELWKMTKDGAS